MLTWIITGHCQFNKYWQPTVKPTLTVDICRPWVRYIDPERDNKGTKRRIPNFVKNTGLLEKVK